MKSADKPHYIVQKTDEEWQQLLTPEEYQILRKKGTEYPHTGVYDTHFADGVYCCKGCGQQLFGSTSKFPTACGWAGFDRSLDGAVTYADDASYGMRRIEILCSACGGHLGHVFDDGPTETKLRYCVNSASLHFEDEEDNN